MEDIDAHAVLTAIPLFAETLDARQLDHLAAQCEPAFFPAGTFLISEGDFGDSMFAIVSGEASVTLHDARGDEHGVASIRPGEIVGEMSLLTGMPRNATVKALSDGEVLEVDKAALANVLWMSPDLVERFVEMLFRRQGELDRAAGGLAWGTMRPGKAELAEMIQKFYQRTE